MGLSLVIDTLLVVLPVVIVTCAYRLLWPAQAEPKPHEPEVAPPRDGALLGYWHPFGWPVRIVAGLPVAIGPAAMGCNLWCARTQEWEWCPPALAREARELVAGEDTVRMRRWA